MAIGDDAVAAGYTPAPGSVAANTIDTELARLADWVAQRTAAVLGITKGGTGSTNAVAARSALGVPSSTAVIQSGNDGTNVLRLTFIDGRFRMRVDATDLGDVATIGDLNAVNSALAAAKVSKGGDTMTGPLVLGSADAVTSGYVALYRNGDGRIGVSPSALKYKKYVSEIDPASLGDVFPQLVRYQLRHGDGTWVYGYLADDLIGTDAEHYAVIIDGEVESIDHTQLLLVQAAQLNERLIQAETALDSVLARLDVLEERS